MWLIMRITSATLDHNDRNYESPGLRKSKDMKMSKVIETAVAALNDKIGTGFDGLAKFVLGDEGSIIVDANGVRAGRR